MSNNVLVTDTHLYNIAAAIRSKNGESTRYKPGEMAEAISNLPSGAVLEPLTVTQNGTYTPDSGVDGFSNLNVNVSNSYSAADEGKVVQNGELTAQTSLNVTENGTYDTTARNSVVVSVAPSGFAFVNVTNHTGEVVTATDGTTTLTGDNSIEQVFLLPNAGTWRFSAGQKSSVLVITTRGTALSVTIGELQLVPWSSGTDDQIVAMIQAAHNGDIDLQTDGGWAVGDMRTITVDAFSAWGYDFPQQDIDIVISEFGDYNNCGSVMQFDFKTTLPTMVPMSKSSNNRAIEGYGRSGIKTAVMPALVAALPQWLQEMLLTFSVLAFGGNQVWSDQAATVDTVTDNKLALRSLAEVNGSGSDGTQVSYYRDISGAINKSGTDLWWLRTKGNPVSGYYTTFRAFHWSYLQNIHASNGSETLAPFGCI